MTNEQIFEKLNAVNKDGYLQNLIAQANARYILFNTNEKKENFPNYSIKDDKLAALALHYLNLGCSLAENEDLEGSRSPLEMGASILENIHGSESNKTETSNYYGLISALAYYVSFQYSKSFILIRKIESTTTISKLLKLFIQRDFNELTQRVNEIIFDDSYKDGSITENEEDKIYEIIIARSLDNLIKYFYSGNEQYLTQARKTLKNLKEIAELQQEPGIWWVIRLLLLITEGLTKASLWNVLKSHFDIASPDLVEYIRALVYQYPRGIYELFLTQRKSLPKVLNTENKGCIVSVPTSSGKTRIAEIAILDCVLQNAENKVLYIAPFRSLAFEVENALDKTLSTDKISISQLYGGSLYSKLDEKIIEDSNVIIATPEKAKAIFRGNPDLMNQIKLIIIDEGHLLGANKRLIVNEVFYEELRYFVEKNKGRFLLLSAVLPNSEDLAQWLTESKETIYKDKWRPSDERFGILEWTGNSVNLNWESSDRERESFNRRFIVSDPNAKNGNDEELSYMLENKNDAVAATAHKMRRFGPVLIFVGRKDSVFVMAQAYYKCMNRSKQPEDFVWNNTNDWRAFEMACIETYGEGNRWLQYAQKGILCHNADLHADVRLPLERLMRTDRPLVIIATSTLGQGVNLGVSSVIFSTLYQGQPIITARDFWNIAGRAGRAFVDHEGKILVALDASKGTERQIKWRKEIIKGFFDRDQIDIAQSGILELIKELKSYASKSNIDFNLMLQLISENKIDDIGEIGKKIDETLDWIDDTLLSLHYINNENNEDSIDYGWTEDFFRRSLAFIQIPHQQLVTTEDVLAFFKNRIQGITLKVGDNKSKWKSIIKSGIPLNSDLFIENILHSIIDLIHHYNNTSKVIDDKIILLKDIESMLNGIPVIEEYGEIVKSKDINTIREKWVKGVPISEILLLENGIEIITKLYTFNLPWLLNGIAKKIRNIDLQEEAEIIEEISILVESGLPDIKTVKIYQAGIRSRSAAVELGSFFEDELWNRSIKSYKQELVSGIDFYVELVSQNTKEWLELLARVSNRKDFVIDNIPNFTLGETHKLTDTLIAKEINGKQHLISLDFKVVEDISSSEINFKSVNKIPGIFFKYSHEEECWKLTVENPYVRINSSR